MSISNTVALSTGLYVPFRGHSRVERPLGSIQVTVSDVGDASGGGVTLAVTMSRIEFGFHPILIWTWVTWQDTAGAPTDVALQYRPAGNERMNNNMTSRGLPIITADSSITVKSFSGSELSALIEPDQEEAEVVALISDNQNTVNYQGVFFGLLYDAEAMARHVGLLPDPAFYGIR